MRRCAATRGRRWKVAFACRSSSRGLASCRRAKTYDQPVIELGHSADGCCRGRQQIAANVDGVDLLPHLRGEATAAPHESLYWRFGPQKAVRKGNWKLVDWRDFDTKINSGWQLYDRVE